MSTPLSVDFSSAYDMMKNHDNKLRQQLSGVPDPDPAVAENTSKYPDWVKTDDDKFAYEAALLDFEREQAASAAQMANQIRLMEKQQHLQIEGLEKTWKANVDGMKSAGINPILYFSGGGSAGNSSISSGSAARADVPSLASTASNLRSSAKQSDAQLTSAFASAVSSIIGAFMIFAAAKGGNASSAKPRLK